MANVLLHSLLFPPDATANSYIFSDIARELKCLGHTLYVVTTTPHYGVLKENTDKQPLRDGLKKWYKTSDYYGIKCFHISVPSEKGGIKQRLLTYLKFHYYAVKLLKTEKINAEVVIAQSPPITVGIVNAIIANRLKAKAVYIVQDLFPDGPILQGKIKNPLLKFLLRKIEKRVYDKSDAIVAISKGIKDRLAPRVLNGKHLKHIPNFVDTDIYYPMGKDDRIKQKYGIKGSFIISYVGNIGNAHDLSPIIHCAEALKELELDFLIAGNGIKLDYYKKLAEEKMLDNIHFAGYIPREETPQINAVSDLCLVMLAPHVQGTSFPSKIYTLMGMSKPIVLMCSDESDVRDFITESKAGWIIKSGDAVSFTELIKSLYHNRGYLEECGSNSLAVIKNGYTKQIVGKQYDKLIKELLNTKD